MSELQDLYETINPIPEDMSRCGEGYCQHVYMLIDPYASGYTARFEGFKQGLKHRQTEVEELTYKAKLRESDYQALLAKYQVTKKCWNDRSKENGELQERLDAVIQQAKEFIQSCKDDADIFEDKYQAKVAYGAEAVVELLEQALKGGSTPDLNTDENGGCRHFSTTMFADGKAECFHCDVVVNENREVIGKQSKGLHPFFKKEPK